MNTDTDNIPAFTKLIRLVSMGWKTILLTAVLAVAGNGTVHAAGQGAQFILERGGDRFVLLDPGDGMTFLLLRFQATEGTFVRQNPDGSLWLHTFSPHATATWGIPINHPVRQPEDLIPLWVGNGLVQLATTVELNPDGETVSLEDRRFNLTLNLQLTSTAFAEALGIAPDGTPFWLQVQRVVRDGEEKVFRVVFEPQ